MSSEERQGLNRRELIGTAGAAALGAAGGLALGGTAAGAAASPDAAPGLPAFELEELTAADLAAGLASGKWTSRRLTELYLERIATLDRGPQGPNAVAETNPDALAIAAELDAERRAGKLRGPLHGIPVLIKDNIDSGDRMWTTAGSLALAGSRAARDAFLVERLRAAGAVLLGKTNLSEWANIRSPRSTSGWSGRGGQVRNPYALDRNPCGSSSGTGAAISANLAPLGVGTETDGSIICPSSMCGLVGLKPTVGLVSRSGVIPISATQDTAGPMTRTVADAALLLAALAGNGSADPRDPATARAAGQVADFAAALDPRGLAGARLGLVRAFFGWHPEIEDQMKGLIAVLEGAGAVLVDPVEIPHLADLDPLEGEVLHYEFKAGVNAYLAGLPVDGGHPRNLAELIDFNRRHAAEEMPWFGQETFEKCEAKGPLTDEPYTRAVREAARLSRAEGIDAVLGKHRLDALVCPSMGPAYLTDWVNGDHYAGAATSPCAVAGYPHLTVPAGFVHGLPWGLSFMGPAWSEARLLRLGYAFEQATMARRAPRFAPTVDVGRRA